MSSKRVFIKKDDSAFDCDDKYKLYRNVYEIIHPTISKRNISNYRIVLGEKLAPVRVFYPDKVSSLKSVIIFIHGDPIIADCVNSYEKICKEISMKTDKLIIALDYKNCRKNSFLDCFNECYDTILYLYEELENNGILNDKIVLMGDSVGANILIRVVEKSYKECFFKVERAILVYPILEFNKMSNNENLLLVKRVNDFINIHNEEFNKNYYNYLKKIKFDNFPRTLIAVGRADPFREQGIMLFNEIVKGNDRSKLIDITFANHGFLNGEDSEIENNFYSAVNDFLTF